MNRIDTKIPGVYIIEPKVFGDHRGYFMETYSTKGFADILRKSFPEKEVYIIGGETVYRAFADACCGAILTEIGYIKAGVDDIKLEQRDQRAHNESFAARLTAVEGIVHENGRRLDRLEELNR